MKTDFEWARECRYISEVTDKKGMVSEMNFSTETFIRYCEMQREQAEKDAFSDAALYIQECIDDLKGQTMNQTELQIMAHHFIAAALWADSPEGTRPRVTKATYSKALEMCHYFATRAPGLFDVAKQCHKQHGYGAHPDCGGSYPWAAALGQDFYLAAAGHGAGFIDRDTMPPKTRESLGKLARRFHVETEFYRGWLYLNFKFEG